MNGSLGSLLAAIGAAAAAAATGSLVRNQFWQKLSPREKVGGGEAGGEGAREKCQKRSAFFCWCYEQKSVIPFALSPFEKLFCRNSLNETASKSGLLSLLLSFLKCLLSFLLLRQWH